MHPGAVIIERPYDSLDEFLEGDAWTVARGDMVLLGVSGVELGGALEFSIVLSTGEAVVSGEGRVVEYIPPTDEFEGGTRIKFRKLDADSKAVLRRALEVQRRRAQEQAEADARAAAAQAELLPSSAVQELPSSAVAHAPPAVDPPADAAPPPEPAAAGADAPPAPVEPPADLPLAPMTLDPFPQAAAPGPPVPAAAFPAAPAEGLRALQNGRPRQVPPPPDRDALLERLRERHRSRGAA